MTNIKTQILSGIEAQDAIMRGAKILSDAVSSTLGPQGKNVGITYANERGVYASIIMHDGVTVAKSIDLEDEFENMGARFVKEAAKKQVQDTGDGTSVAVLLSYSILKEVYTLVAAGYNPMMLRNGLENCMDKVLLEIESHAIPIKTLQQKRQIATISAQDAELGDMIAEVFDKMGEDGLIIPEESTNAQTKVDQQTGFQIDKGWADPNFMTNPDRGEATIEKPYVLIADGLINNLEPIKGLLEDCAKNHRKLVFIAPQFGLGAAGAMIANKMNGVIPCLLIEAPSLGQNQKNVLQDIAIFTKAKFFSEWTGLKLENATIADLGRCEYIKSTKTETIIVGGTASKDEITMRISEIKKAIEGEEADFDKDKLKERLARLTSGVAVIRVGGATEVEMKERMERVKDSIAATRAALRKGIVAGGEVIYLTAREKLNQKDVAENIIYKALYEPFKKLLNNAAMNDGEWYEKLKSAKKNMGVDVVKQEIVDMIQSGIIDPTEVSIEALRNALSTAVSLSSTGYIVIQKDIDKK
jgi:chaperonin GroEL